MVTDKHCAHISISSFVSSAIVSKCSFSAFTRLFISARTRSFNGRVVPPLGSTQSSSSSSMRASFIMHAEALYSSSATTSSGSGSTRCSINTQPLSLAERIISSWMRRTRSKLLSFFRSAFLLPVMKPRLSSSLLCTSSSDTMSSTPHAVPPAAVNLSINLRDGWRLTPSRTNETPRSMASSTIPSTLDSRTLHVSIQDLTGSSLPSSDEQAGRVLCE
mmetsp:Transcript_1368/g.2977  ORF Transcript_1368/g.2977 Transcript_1368/m.2977 type:complete len:218 (-) Transcript_1368:675-1328(-)